MSKEVVRCFERCQRAGFLPHAEASLICFMQQASSVEGEAGWEMWLLSRPFLFFPFLFYCFHAILFICFLSSGFASFSFPSSFPHPYCVLHWLTSRSPGSRQTFSLDLPLSLSIRLFFVFFLQRGDWQQGQALAFPHLGIEALTGRDSSRGCALNTERQPHFLIERQKESVFCVKHVKEVNFSFVLCRITAFSSSSVQLKPSYCIGFTQWSVQTSPCASHLL